MNVDIDIKALRVIAEAALADSESAWAYVGGPLLGDIHVETRPNTPGRSQIRVDPNAVGPFIAAASPGTILQLIDMIEHGRTVARSIADKAADYAVECATVKIALGLMTEARDEACGELEDTGGEFAIACATELRKVGAP